MSEQSQSDQPKFRCNFRLHDGTECGDDALNALNRCFSHYPTDELLRFLIRYTVMRDMQLDRRYKRDKQEREDEREYA